jgi:hypothetical protein
LQAHIILCFDHQHGQNQYQIADLSYLLGTESLKNAKPKIITLRWQKAEIGLQIITQRSLQAKNNETYIMSGISVKRAGNVHMPEGDLSRKWAWQEEHRSKPEPQWRFSDVPPHHQLRNPFPETFPPKLLYEVRSCVSSQIWK